jgi:hypothetical protein
MTEFLKYPKIFQLGNELNANIFANKEAEIVIQEKIDGGNMRFYIREGRVIFGSHTQELAEEPDKFFKAGVTYLREKLANKDLTKLDNKIFYGEYCVMHSIRYNFETMPRFLGFDIYDLNTQKFMGWKEAKSIYEELGITFVPILRVCKAVEIEEITEAMIPKSVYYEGQAEGIIFKRYTEPVLMAKVVATKFKEVNKSAFGLTKKQAEDDDERVVAIYCTNPRIDKKIFELVERGDTLDLTMMHKLPHTTYADIIEENWREILESNYKLDLRKIRGHIAKRCLETLKRVMINNTLR